MKEFSSVVLPLPAPSPYRCLQDANRREITSSNINNMSVCRPLPSRVSSTVTTTTKPLVTVTRDIKENTLNLEDIRSSPEEVERIYLLCKSLRSLSSVELWPSAELHN